MFPAGLAMYFYMSFTNFISITSVQDVGATRIVIRSHNYNDEEFYVPTNLFNYSQVALDRYTSIPEMDRELGIIFKAEDRINSYGFHALLRFLETGSAMEVPFNIHDSPSDEEKAACFKTWTLGFEVGHFLEVDKFMIHCLRLALKLHGSRPSGVECELPVHVLYTILPLLQISPFGRMYEFLVIATARDWLKAQRNDPTSTVKVSEWEAAFQDFPDLATRIKLFLLITEDEIF